MINIDRLTVREIHLPLKEPFRISSGVEHVRRICLVQLGDGDGQRVWAECVAGLAPNYSPETIDTEWLALREWVAPRVLGRTFQRPSDVHTALEQDFRGHRMAKAVVEMGTWALAAVRAEQSLASLLGQERRRLPVGISLGIQDTPDALVERAAAAHRAGYQKIKIKIAPDFDIPFIAAVRAALGPEAHLMADANSAYTLEQLDILTQLDAFDLMMIEQPLAWDDVVQHAKLQAKLKTPVCLDESITDVQRARDMITLKSGRIVNIKPGRVGGFTSSIAIHDLCAKHDVPVWCGGMMESGVGRAYNVALASLPNFTLPGDLSPSSRYWEQDIVTPEWTMDSQGMVDVPTRPGIGVEVDLDRVDDLTVRSESFRAR